MLVKLEKIDPNSVKRAKTFFPIPSPAAPKKVDSSSSIQKKTLDRAFVLKESRNSIHIASLDDSVAISQLIQTQSSGPVATLPAVGKLNLWASFVVMVLATLMLAVLMWNIATNGGMVAKMVLTRVR